MGEIKEVPLLALTLRLGQREIARGYSISQRDARDCLKWASGNMKL